MTIEELQEQTKPSHCTIQPIICDHLNLRKITARNVPKQLPDFQRAGRIQICQENLAKFESDACRLCDMVIDDKSGLYHRQIGQQSSNSACIARDDPPLQWFDKVFFSSKTLFSLVFKSTSPVWIHYVEPRHTVNHQYYIDYCLKPLINNIRKQRVPCGVQNIKLHYDNKRSHIRKDVSNYFESEGITVIPHPPNSPDLSPSDFWLFDLIKHNLTDQNNSESLCLSS